MIIIIIRNIYIYINAQQKIDRYQCTYQCTNKTKEDKTWQGKTKEDKTRQGNTREDN